MPYRILYTEEALSELGSILDFISMDNPSAAARFGESLLDHIDVPAELPELGGRGSHAHRPASSSIAPFGSTTA